MVCCNCVIILAKRLYLNHNVEWIRALELAENGIKRAEQRQTTEQHNLILSENDPWDYTLPCIVGGSCSCRTSGYCEINPECAILTLCTCSCPPPSDPNSHLEQNACVTQATGCLCRTNICRGGTCTCGCGGECRYHCNPGYTWNHVTLQCEIAARPAFKGNGLTWMVTQQ